MGNVCKNRDSSTRPHPKGVSRPASHWRRRCAGPSICPRASGCPADESRACSTGCVVCCRDAQNTQRGECPKSTTRRAHPLVRKRWESLVFKAEGVDRRFYELCTLSALKNALRSGDLWVQGSRQFKDFGDDL